MMRPIGRTLTRPSARPLTGDGVSGASGIDGIYAFDPEGELEAGDDVDLVFTDLSIAGVLAFDPEGELETGDDVDLVWTETQLTYQHYKDGVAIDGATSATLSLTNIDEDDNGSYTLVATNPLTGQSKVFGPLVVSVVSGPVDPPVITVQPVATEVYEGQTATFTVTATGATSYQWQKSDNAGVDWSNVSGATSSSYTTAATVRTTDNDDRYRCNVTNAGGTTTSSAVALTVWNPLALGADLACWIDPTFGLFTERTGASATTAVGDGDPVGTVRAKNGTINGIAGADAQRGIYRATGLNGTPAIELDGADDRYIFTANLAGIFRNKAFGYIFAAVKPEAETVSGTFFGASTALAVGSARATAGFNSASNAGQLGFGGRRLDANSFQSAISADSQFTNNEDFVYGLEIVWNAASAYIRKNGTRIASSTSFQTDGSTSDTDSLAVILGASSAQLAPFDGMIGHLIITTPSSAHDSTIMEKIEGFINYKSGAIY